MSSESSSNYLDNGKLSSSYDSYDFAVGASPALNRAAPSFPVSDAEKRIIDMAKREQLVGNPAALPQKSEEKRSSNLSAQEMEAWKTYSAGFKRRMHVLPQNTPTVSSSGSPTTSLSSPCSASDNTLAKSALKEKDQSIISEKAEEKIVLDPMLERAKWTYHFQFKNPQLSSSSSSTEVHSLAKRESVSTPLADRRNREDLLASGEIPENALSQITDVVSANLSRIAAGGSLIVTGTTLGPVLVTVAATGALPAIAPGVLGTAIAGGVITCIGLGVHELNQSGSVPESLKKPMERVELVFSIASVGLLAVAGIGLGIPVISAADLLGSANNTLTISAAAADVRAALSNIGKSEDPS